MRRFILLLVTVLVLPLAPVRAEEKPGFVRLPLAEYTRLTEAAREPRQEPRRVR